MRRAGTAPVRFRRCAPCPVTAPHPTRRPTPRSCSPPTPITTSVTHLFEHDHLARLDGSSVDQHRVALVEVVGQARGGSVHPAAQLDLSGAHGSNALDVGVVHPVGESVDHPLRRQLVGGLLDLALADGDAGRTGHRAADEPRHSLHHADLRSLRRSRFTARDVPVANAAVLMTGVLSATRATRPLPEIAPLMASAEPSTRSKRSRSSRASSTVALTSAVDSRNSASNGPVSCRKDTTSPRSVRMVSSTRISTTTRAVKPRQHSNAASTTASSPAVTSVRPFAWPRRLLLRVRLVRSTSCPAGRRAGIAVPPSPRDCHEGSRTRPRDPANGHLCSARHAGERELPRPTRSARLRGRS